MAISLASLRHNAEAKPPIVTLFGVAGIGKTTFAASAPSPVFIQTEDGLGTIDAPTFGVLKSYSDVLDAIGSLYTEDHQYKTVVLDSLDWTEPLVASHVAKANGWATVETPGYGKGYVAAADEWRVLMDGFRALRDDKKMTIILIAHAAIKRFDAPGTEPYSRYILKLNDRIAAIVCEASDCICFANYRTSVVKTDAGFGRKLTRGAGSGERLLHCEERPAYIAKQRYRIPETIALDWSEFSSGIPFYQTETKAQESAQ